MSTDIFKFQVFCRRRAACRAVAVASALGMLTGGSLTAVAGPTQVLGDTGLGGASYNYAKGATVTPNAELSAATISSSGTGLIDWHALNIGAGQSLDFQGAQFFNVVSGGNASQIAGALKANGALWIFNPAGVSFLNGANVNVGGLFAVASAGLSNQSDIEAAIEAGTAIPTPQLGTASGMVQVEGGAVVSAQQAAFMGKSVALADGADFTGVDQLTLAAGGRLAIDEVAGGRISIRIADFADDDTGMGIELGDLQIGDETHDGNLTAVTEGTIAVKGAVIAKGDIDFRTQAKAGSSLIVGRKQMSVASGKLLQGKSVSATSAGKIAADGSIVATDGDVVLGAADGIELNAVSATTLTLKNATTISGTVSATRIDAADQTVTVKGAANVNATAEVAAGTLAVEAGQVSAATITARVEQSGGTVTATDSITGDATVTAGTLTTAKLDGSLTQDDGQVTVGAVTGELKQNGGTVVAKDGALTVGGKLTQTGGSVASSGTLALNGGADIAGTVSAATSVTAADQVLDVAATGSLTAPTIEAADLKTAGTVEATTVNADVEQTAGTLTAETVDGTLDQAANGTLTAKEVTGAATVAGTVNGDGGLTFGSTLDQTAGTIDAQGDLSVAGTAETAGMVKGADITVGEKLTQTGGSVASSGTLALNGGADIAGTVSAATSVTAADQVLDVAATGSLTAPTIEAADLKTAGTVEATTVNADVEQTAGTLTAKDAQGLTLNGAVEQIRGTIGAAAGDVILRAGTDKDISLAGTVRAERGDVVLEGNDVVASGTIAASADLTVRATGKIDLDGTVTAVDATLTADGTLDVANAGNDFSGTVKAEGASVKLADRNDITLGRVNGTSGFVVVEAGQSVRSEGPITAQGNLRIRGGRDVTLNGATTAKGSVTVLAGGSVSQGADITVTDASATVDVEAENGSIVMADGTKTRTAGGNVSYVASGKIDLATVDAGNGNAYLKAGDTLTTTANGTVSAKGFAFKAQQIGTPDNPFNLDVATLALAARDGIYVRNARAAEIGSTVGMAGNFSVNRVKSDATTEVLDRVADGEDVSGITVENGPLDLVNNGTLTQTDAGRVTVGGETSIRVVGGDLELGNAGNDFRGGINAEADNVLLADANDMELDHIVAAGSATLVAGGNIVQNGATVKVDHGRADETRLDASVRANTIRLEARGNIGRGTHDYLVVGGGTVSATAGGNVSLASAGTEDLKVGIVAGRDVSLYTAGKLVTEDTVSAAGSTTVSAKRFGGAARHAFGSSLTVNNFNQGARPLLAIFETKGGNRTPHVKNQPNDTIVFIDGRLAGGDIQVINKLGALEAFPVQTPELKSEQGVFGNPNFLHDELDVANPFAVGAIDFLLQDIPRLTLASDFPLEVEKQVAANGLNPTTSYWFGQNPQTEQDDESEK